MLVRMTCFNNLDSDLQGAFALEDAMTRGAPIDKEVQLLRQATGGVGNDELIDIALQSLPEEILKEGTLTQSQLQYEASHSGFSVLVVFFIIVTEGHEVGAAWDVAYADIAAEM